jgi:hypothetical protein
MSDDTNVVYLSRLASSLYDDIQHAPDRQSALQLIAEAFEKVGYTAIRSHTINYLRDAHEQEEKRRQAASHPR